LQGRIALIGIKPPGYYDLTGWTQTDLEHAPILLMFEGDPTAR
jgi:hypothetical protein